MNDLNSLIKQHTPGFAGLKLLYPRDLLKKAVLWPTVVSFVLIVLLLVTKAEPQKLITTISDATISVMPSLLGFLLGGYTILISFSNNKLLSNLTEVPKDSEISIFQKVSCIFALTILVQSATLIFALIVKFSLLINSSFALQYSWVLWTFKAVDYVVAYFLMSMLFYTVFAFKDIIVNIFGLTQAFHLTVVI